MTRHTAHRSKALRPSWDGLLEANDEHLVQNGEPMFSSNMFDLSEESIEENMEISAKYLKRMAAIDCHLEVEIGITGGEEDGVDHTAVAPEDRDAKPAEIPQGAPALEPRAPRRYPTAAARGPAHGADAPGRAGRTAQDSVRAAG